MNNRLKEFVDSHRDSFDDINPDPMILGRIETELKLSRVKRNGLLISLMKWSAAAVVVSLAGFGLLQLVNQESLPEPVAEAEVKIETEKREIITPIDDSTRLDLSIGGDLNHTENILVDSKTDLVRQAFFSKLSHASASERYSAVLSAAEIQKIDNDIIGVLVKTMNEDPNSNVRLAALESLSRFSREPLVKKQLIKSLSIQKDPVVQIALIELLTAMRENKIIDELQKITNDETTTQPVKDEAYKSLNNLHS